MVFLRRRIMALHQQAPTSHRGVLRDGFGKNAKYSSSAPGYELCVTVACRLLRGRRHAQPNSKKFSPKGNVATAGHSRAASPRIPARPCWSTSTFFQSSLEFLQQAGVREISTCERGGDLPAARIKRSAVIFLFGRKQAKLVARGTRRCHRSQEASLLVLCRTSHGRRYHTNRRQLQADGQFPFFQYVFEKKYLLRSDSSRALPQLQFHLI